MEPIDVREIMYTLSVVEEKNFSKAAEKLFVSQPALSKTIKQVETKLGCKIFDRSTNPLRLTPHGTVIIEYFMQIQNIQREIEEYSKAVKEHIQSDLKVGAPSFFCSYVLPSIVAKFNQEYPKIKIKLVETNDTDLRTSFKAGNIDIGLSVEHNMPQEFSSEIIMKEHIILAVPQDFMINEKLKAFALKPEDIRSGKFLSSRFKAVKMIEFANEPFLFLKQGNDMYRRGKKICKDAGFVPKINIEMDQLLSTYYMAGAGAGLAFIRSNILNYIVSPNSLIFYKIDHKATERDLKVYYRRQPYSGLQGLFINYIRTNLMSLY